MQNICTKRRGACQAPRTRLPDLLATGCDNHLPIEPCVGAGGLEKAGYKLDCRLRNYTVKDHHIGDALIYAKLRE